MYAQVWDICVRCLLCMNHDGYRLSENIFEPIKFQMGIPGLFLFISVFSNKPLQILQQINVKIVHPVNCTGIRTHNLLNLSLLP